MTKKEKRMAFAPIPHLHGKTENLHDVQRTLANPEPFDQAAALFACLADNTRLRLFWLLCHREECVVNLSALLHMSSPAVSHHLRSLKDRGLVDSRRIGKEVHYRAAEGEVCRLLHRMVEQAVPFPVPGSIHTPGQKPPGRHTIIWKSICMKNAPSISWPGFSM